MTTKHILDLIGVLFLANIVDYIAYGCTFATGLFTFSDG